MFTVFRYIMHFIRKFKYLCICHQERYSTKLQQIPNYDNQAQNLISHLEHWCSGALVQFFDIPFTVYFLTLALFGKRYEFERIKSQFGVDIKARISSGEQGEI